MNGGALQVQLTSNKKHIGVLFRLHLYIKYVRRKPSSALYKNFGVYRHLVFVTSSSQE